MGSKKPMPPAPVGRRPIYWMVQLRIPVDERLVRRASTETLAKGLAKTLLLAINDTPATFLQQSAERVKAELKARENVLVNPEGKPYRM